MIRGAPLLALGLSACVSRTEVFEEKRQPDEHPECATTPLECAFPSLPRLNGVRVEQRGDTAIVHFAGVDGAVDYRIYDPGDPDNVAVNAQGRVVVRDAVYRCAGARQLVQRPVRNSLQGDVGGFYSRSEAESTLGYVYLEPRNDRVAIRRLADPRADADSDYDPPAVAATRAARYVEAGPRANDLLALGYRDDGVAFYAPGDPAGSHPVYFWQSAPRSEADGRRLSVYFSDGPERDAFLGAPSRESFERDFRALDEQASDAVPLTRVFYAGGNDHDVLAAGAAERDRVLRQGNSPVFTLAWPGLRRPTTLVVEALDAGCPYAGRLTPGRGARSGDEPWKTPSEAALASGELFINGQHAASSRPAALARSFVEVAPRGGEGFELFDDFDDESTWEALGSNGGNSARRENGEWLLEASHLESYAVGSLFGQLWFEASDDGGAGLLLLTRKLDFALSATSYLHATIQLNLAATSRRYPVVQLRGQEQSIVVRAVGVPNATFGQAVHLELQHCVGTTWRPDATCPHTALEGRRPGDVEDPSPWAPVPVPGELAGFDWPVSLDVYASTRRAYLFLDGQPAGCGSFPAGALREGPVQVAFGSVSFDSRNDEATLDESSPHQYLLEYGAGRDSRRFDQLGVGQRDEPDWQDELFPCGTDWVP